jgi:hypothetical protein
VAPPHPTWSSSISTTSPSSPSPSPSYDLFENIMYEASYHFPMMYWICMSSFE